ncbi:MAG TPA: hypothetical protein VNA11_01375 [Pseudonocardia sp.]|nr:hypothetical protein [Pseudonocardia sp.]
MTGPRSRWGPISGVLLCLSWAPMVLAVPRLPALGSAAEVEAFWRTNTGLLQATILSVSVGFLFLLDFLGALAERLHAEPGARAAGWTAFGSALMFMTALNVAIGLDLAGGLLLDLAPGATYLLHTAGFLLAAPAAFAGAAFFVAVAGIAFTTAALPRWSGWVAVAGAIANAGAVLGALSLTGPLNTGNGLIGGIAAPLGAFVVWILGVSLHWLRRPADGRAEIGERAVRS